MIRRSSKRLFLRELISEVTARAPGWRGNGDALSPAQTEFVPRFRRLEPRFVLNATAELNAIGQLLVMGTDDPETVQLQIDGNGDLQLLDENDAIIPIEGHPDGPGNEGDPLDPSAITAGQIRFDVGGGNDLLDLELPSGLDVTVIDGDGDDTAVLRFSEDQSPGTVVVNSEQIDIDSASAVIAANDAMLVLSGDVMLGTDGQSTELALGTGSLDVTGRLIASGDVLISGTGVSVDLSAATVTAQPAQSSLTFDLVNQPGSELSLGGADDSAGSFLEAIEVRSASSVSFLNSPLQVSGDVTVEDVEIVSVDADIDTTSGLQDGDVFLQAMTTTSITSDALINVGDGTITIDGGGGTIDLSDGRLQSDNAGEAITIVNAGDVMLGDVTAAFGALTLGEIGAEVGDVGQSPDTALIADRLSIDSTGSVDLSNPQNQFRLLERLDVEGDVSISDSLSNLTVIDIDSRGQNVTLKSSGSILIARIEAISADVRITAASVNDAFDDTLADITASRVFIDSTSGIGNLRPLELMSVNELTASSESGDIALSNLGPGPLEIRSVIAGDGAITIDSQSTMTATEVNSQNSSGLTDGSRDVTLTVFGSNNELLVTSITAASGADARLTAASVNDAFDDTLADITASRVFIDATSGIGNLRALELMSVNELTASSESGDITLSNLGPGPLDLRSVIAGDGAITIDSQSTITATEVTSQNSSGLNDGSRDVTLTVFGSTNELLVTSITAAGGADTRLTAASVNDTFDDMLSDITASRVFIDATSGIGNLRPLELMSVNELTARSESGDITLSNLGPGPLELRSVIAGDGAITIDSQSTMTATEVTSQNSSGLDDGSRDVMLTVFGSMNELLVTSITAAGGADARLTAASVNDTFDDTLADITASRVFINATSGIGNLRPLELMSVNELTATSQSGDITLDSLGPGPIELRSVIAGDGAITISSVGTMIATAVTSENASELDDGSRDISLTALGSFDDILVASITADGGADVLLTAGDDILDTDGDDPNLIAADDLKLLAQNGTADSEIAISLSTRISDLEAAVSGENRGDLLLREQDSISLASSDAQGDEIIETSNGQIVILAGARITIVDTSLGDDGADLNQDPEIVARGDHGRIDLETPDTIELLDDVQLHAEQVTTRYPDPDTVNNPAESELQREDRAVFLTSNTVVFGERIEINTGVDQGVARFFAPRPIVVIDRSDPDHPKPAPPTDPDSIPAFFEPFTVATNVLEQAAVNDAAGILTIDIGRTGERGLTVDIDWGAPTSGDGAIGQFQQLNGLSADASIAVGIDSDGRPLDPVVDQGAGGVLQVEHLYKQSAILESRENGRASATDPLEVRFAVRQHDSILVEANTVAQAPDFEAIPVDGRIVSSTDNPLTPADSPNGLENGQASFIIPSLTIPVAFIPARDVIPEFETPEIIVRSDTFTPLIFESIQTEESTASSSVGREEYFQIRILSPDPEGDFLAEPQRLPDDILNADQLTRLFAELPDGRYEIDYVLGDGNERSILRVDVESGQATIPSEALEAEGLLMLEEWFEQSRDESDSGATDPEAAVENVEALRDEDPRDGNDGQRGQPEVDDSTMHDADPTAPSIAGAMIATTIQRRYRRRHKRLSAAGRFAACRQRHSHAEDAR